MCRRCISSVETMIIMLCSQRYSHALCHCHTLSCGCYFWRATMSTEHNWYRHYVNRQKVHPWAPAGFFSGTGIGQTRGSGWMKISRRVQGWSPSRGLGAKPISWRHILKIMHKHFVCWNFRKHYWCTKTLHNISRWGQVPPLAHA